jgi:nicotinamide-nucleotide amidase
MPPAEHQLETDVTGTVSDRAIAVVRRLTQLARTVAVAESLTGGQVVAALIDAPGASMAVRGGIVAYSTGLKSSLLGVDSALLAARGPVDAEVAQRMAEGVREATAVEGERADYGVATTGVAGPDPQGSTPVGLVFVAVADAHGTEVRELHLRGGRSAVRAQATREALELLLHRLSAMRE